jgi:hypothetical protein
VLQTDSVLDTIRRELRRVSPDVKIDSEQIKDVLRNEVIKREVLEGEKATEAVKKINRSASKALRAATKTLVSDSTAPAMPTSE